MCDRESKTQIYKFQNLLEKTWLNLKTSRKNNCQMECERAPKPTKTKAFKSNHKATALKRRSKCPIDEHYKKKLKRVFFAFLLVIWNGWGSFMSLYVCGNKKRSFKKRFAMLCCQMKHVEHILWRENNRITHSLWNQSTLFSIKANNNDVYLWLWWMAFSIW